jgi:hypothetical protein
VGLCAGTNFSIPVAEQVLPRNTCDRWPKALRRSAAAARVWDLLDGALGFALSPLAQNFWFVARKPNA